MDLSALHFRSPAPLALRRSAGLCGGVVWRWEPCKDAAGLIQRGELFWEEAVHFYVNSTVMFLSYAII